MISMISRMKGKHSHLPPVVENGDVEDFLSPETCVVVTVLSSNKQLNIFIIMVEDKSTHVTTTSSSKMWSRHLAQGRQVVLGSSSGLGIFSLDRSDRCWSGEHASHLEMIFYILFNVLV